MQLNKKLLSSAMTTLLILSIVAATAPAFALTTSTTVTLTPSSGPVGTVVTVSGTADANPFGTIGVFWENLGNLLNGTSYASSTGSFSAKVTIPSATNGTHAVVVQDSLGTTASGTFTVTPSLSRGFTAKALPGDSLTLTGNGFSASSAVVIVLVAPNATTNVTLTAPTITSNATGSFSAVITIPNTITVADFSTTAWTILAIDASTVNATASVTIDYYATTTPVSGPTGITVTVAGRIAANKAYSVNFGSAVGVFAGTSSATGAFTGTYTLTGPIVPGQAYAAVVIWDVTESRTATFTGRASPTITLSTTIGVVGAAVSVNGSGFSASADITLSIGSTVANSTATDIRFGPTNTGGVFGVEQFVVPTIAPGTYYLTVVDQYGATTGTAYTFTVSAAPVTSIALRASSYSQGDTLSFNIITTEATTGLGTINVYIIDPTARTQFSSSAWTLTAAAADNTRYVQLQTQLDASSNRLTLPDDAPTGTWNWTITYLPASLGGAVLVKESSLFTVTAKATLDAVSATLNQVNTTVTANAAALTAIDAKLVSIDGKVATLSTSMGTVTTSVNALSASISTISNGVATINTKVGTIQTSLSSLDAVLGVVAGDTATLSTSLGAVTTSLASITPTLTSIQNGIATIETAVGTLQGTVTSINNGVVTVQTGVGTLQTSVGNLQPDVTAAKDNSAGVSSLLYVAIVLALVAAIAAIASIFLMRQKIAG